MRCISPWYNRTGWLGVKDQLIIIIIIGDVKWSWLSMTCFNSSGCGLWLIKLHGSCLLENMSLVRCLPVKWHGPFTSQYKKRYRTIILYLLHSQCTRVDYSDSDKEQAISPHVRNLFWWPVISSVPLRYCCVCLKLGSTLVHNVKLWHMSSERIPANGHCIVRVRRRYPIVRRFGVSWNFSVEAAEEGLPETGH